MPRIVLYKCDGPDCEELGSPVEQQYYGKYPHGWLRILIWGHNDLTQEWGQSEGPCFHTRECMSKWLVKNGYVDER